MLRTPTTTPAEPREAHSERSAARGSVGTERVVQVLERFAVVPWPVGAVWVILSGAVGVLLDAQLRPGGHALWLMAVPVLLACTRFGLLGGLSVALGAPLGVVGTALLQMGPSMLAPSLNRWALDAATLATVAVVVAEMQRTLLRERRLAMTDSLTGLPNARAFADVLRREVARASRFPLALTVVYLDVDDFKYTNDTLGHHAGDSLLIELGEVLREASRQTDFFARLGGDEFAGLLVGVDARTAHQVVLKLKSAVGDRLGTKGFKNGVSVGAVTFPEAPESARSVITQADEAMYASKRAGKNRITFVTAKATGSTRYQRGPTTKDKDNAKQRTG